MQALVNDLEHDVRANKAAALRATGGAPTQPLYSRDHYTPINPAKAIHASTARFVAMCAGVRSGKTFTAAHVFLERIEADYNAGKDRLWYWVIGPTYDLCDMFREYIEEVLLDSDIQWNYNGQKHLMTIPSHGIKIWFKSADKDKNLRARGLRGVLMTESAAIKEKIWTNRVYSRLSDKKGWAILEGSPEGHNWFYHFCKKSPMFTQDPGNNADVAYYHWTTSENNAVPELAEESEEAKRHMPKAIHDREYGASFNAFEGQIFTEWDAQIHVIGPNNKMGISKIPSTWVETRYGFDAAFGHNGVLIVLIRDSQDIWYAVDEICANTVLPEEWGGHLKTLRNRWGFGEIRHSHDRPEYKPIFQAEAPGARVDHQWMNVNGGVVQCATIMHPVDGKMPRFFVLPKIKYDGETAGNIPETVAKHMEQGQSIGCKQLIKEIPAQLWGPDEKPVKKEGHEDDAVDAWRYAYARDPKYKGFIGDGR